MTNKEKPALARDPIGTASTKTNAAKPIVRIRDVSKSFPGVLAVSSATLDIYPGEVVGLVGQNGAGKSTLVQILAGVHSHGTYTGEVSVSGDELVARTVREAEDAGIVMIPQHVSVVEDMTVAENIFLNREPTKFGFVDWERLYSEAEIVLDRYRVDVDPRRPMAKLDLAHQQLVTIASVLHRNPRVLILDEPTASLTEVEAERLFAHIRAFRERGVACIFVSHRLAEVFELADRIVVMRDGKIRGIHRVASTDSGRVVAEMLGGESVTSRAARETSATRDVTLRVSNLVVNETEQNGKPRVQGISFNLHRGEILGLFGLVGSGCTAVVKALFGAWEGQWTGDVWVNGVKRSVRNPAEAIDVGLGLITEDRHEALMLEQSVHDNIVVASLPWFSRMLGVLDLTGLRLAAREQFDLLDVKARSLATRVNTLSGGNQQKVVVARWLNVESKIFLLDDPTRGVDVGARAEIHRLLSDLAQQGCSILIISSEAEEASAICDRVLVMRRGEIVNELASTDLDEKRLIQAASGTQ